MITPNKGNDTGCKCARCKTVVPAYEDSYRCMYCEETYCPSCLGYTKFFDIAELEDLIMAQMPPGQLPYQQ